MVDAPETQTAPFRALNVAVVGGGIGGLTTALSLRREGHKVTVYERTEFLGETGASISCAANGTRFLKKWGFDVPRGLPVPLGELTMRDWHTGEVLNEYPLGDYEERWGNIYWMFHRQDFHDELQHAIVDDGPGPKCKIAVNHRARNIDVEKGVIEFDNGTTVTADLIVGADGIRSVVREKIGVVADSKPANVTAYRCNISREKIDELGLPQPGKSIEFWGGFPSEGVSQHFKIVMAPCRKDELISFYCFMPTHLSPHRKEGFRFESPPHSELLDPYNDVKLDPYVMKMLEHSIDLMPWRLYIHQPYTHWTQGKACILGDAAHPMLPNQSQGACMAIEDSGALGIVFSKDYSYTSDVKAGLAFYERLRKTRATRVQEASRRATENLNERIGFSSLSAHDAKLAAAADKLTVNEICGYNMEEHARELAATA